MNPSKVRTRELDILRMGPHKGSIAVVLEEKRAGWRPFRRVHSQRVAATLLVVVTARVVTGPAGLLRCGVQVIGGAST